MRFALVSSLLLNVLLAAWLFSPARRGRVAEAADVAACRGEVAARRVVLEEAERTLTGRLPLPERWHRGERSPDLEDRVGPALRVAFGPWLGDRAPECRGQICRLVLEERVGDEEAWSAALDDPAVTRLVAARDVERQDQVRGADEVLLEHHAVYLVVRPEEAGR